jgi:hypothetical protein
MKSSAKISNTGIPQVFNGFSRILGILILCAIFCTVISARLTTGVAILKKTQSRTDFHRIFVVVHYMKGYYIYLLFIPRVYIISYRMIFYVPILQIIGCELILPSRNMCGRFCYAVLFLSFILVVYLVY